MSRKQIGEILREYREASGLSVKGVSQFLTEKGFKASPNTVYSWENNNSQPTPDALLSLCELYGITDVLETFGYSQENEKTSELLNKEETSLVENYRTLSIPVKGVVYDMVEKLAVVEKNTKKEQESNVTPLFQNDNIVELPIVGDVAAGSPIEDNSDSYDDYDTVTVDAKYKGLLALHVCGDSMEPKFADGSFLIVKRQSSLENGQIGVFMLDNEFSCKKFKVDKNGVSLVSLNPNYEPMVLSQDEFDEVNIYGLVVDGVEQ